MAVLTHPTCLNSSDGAIDITVTGGTPPYTYVWTTIGGSGLTPGTQDQTGLTAGLYQVIVTDANGCEVKEEYVLIGQNSAPIAAFDIEEDCLYASQTIHFIDQSTVTGLPIYSWNFGDGSFDFSQNPAHPYTYDGFYCIQLTVTNICGTATESKPIYVMPSDCSCDPSITYYYTDGDLISSYCTIPNNSNIRGTVTIMPNVTVNIPNNATIRFAANAKLIVMPNATLNIGTGAILTSLAGCNEMWQGIEVWSNKLNRGNVFISTAATSLTQGATISNAHIGVLLGSRNLEKICNTGANQYANNAQTGRIIARYVKFHNDGTGIYFTTPIYTNANYCSIRDCEFRTNGILFDPMYDIDNNPHYTAGQNNDHNPFIEMANRRGVGNHGIRMEKANDIVFGNNWFWYLDAGMESFDNRYTVEGSHFNFCKYGIRINNTNIFINTPHNINSNYFDNIPGYAGDFGYAICVVSSRNDNILRNVFGTYSSVNNINSNGILLSNSGGFNIKDNEFWYFKKGISVYNSGKGGGFIGPASTGNKFKRCNESIFTSGTNLWLKIRCNEFTNDDPSYYSGNTWSNWGALANQGSFPPLSTVYPDRWPAGNRFLSPNDKEISTLSGVGTTYHYVHHASPFYTIPWPINVILDPTTYPMGSTSCYTEAKIGTDINGLTYQKDSLDNIVAELKYQLLIVTSNLDKGNTSGLLSAINSNLAQGKLKNMLVNHSPLSNTVISELMASDGRLSPGNYKNVMEKNLPVNREIEPLFLEDLQGLPPGIAMQLQALNGNNPSVVTTASIIRQIDRADMMRNQVLSALY
ncbi:MAG: hypothetical protein HY738_11580, partial [Bacteroidia bacterium]|nr:hypothetical protein [Bacteroidia bacterium]